MARSNTIRVTYTIKNDRGFLVDLEKPFLTHKDAIEFIKSINKIVIGKPIIELEDK